MNFRFLPQALTSTLLLSAPVAAHPGHGDHDAGMATIFHTMMGPFFAISVGGIIVFALHVAMKNRTGKRQRARVDRRGDAQR